MPSVEAAPRRRPSTGGYARGDETRVRIVDAAMDVFAAEGFANASTRRIAALAGVTPPALQYYFDSKEGLHRACADRIVELVSGRLDPELARAREATAGYPDAAADALCDLLDVLIDLSLTARDTPLWRRFVARAQSDDEGPAYARIKAALSQPMHAVARALVARATGLPESDDTVGVQVVLLLGQLSAFHHSRDQTLRFLGWSDLEDAGLALIKATVRRQTRAGLAAARSEALTG